MKIYLEVSFIEESRLGTFAKEEHVIEVLKNLPKANLSPKEIKMILSMFKKDKNNRLYDWRDFINWSYITLSSFCKKRSKSFDIERKKSDFQLNKNFSNNNLDDKKYKNLTEISEKLLKLIKLKFDDKDKCLTLSLPGRQRN